MDFAWFLLMLTKTITCSAAASPLPPSSLDRIRSSSHGTQSPLSQQGSHHYRRRKVSHIPEIPLLVRIYRLVIWLTGDRLGGCPGCSGIGLESSLLFASEGAHVVCADINAVAAARTVDLISQMEGAPRAIALTADVGKEADIVAMVAKALEEFGRLDVMFNNAG